jgi:hypothetical protein
MPEQSTLYLEMLETLQTGGCPLCRLGRRSSDSYLNALIHEGVTDPALREELRKANGLCHRQGWRLAEQRGSLPGIAIIYQDVLNNLVRGMEGQETATRRRGSRHSFGSVLEASTECPACRLEKDAVDRAAKTLLAHLQAPEMAAAYQSAGGLCLPHLRLVLGRAGDAQARALLEWQTTIWRGLKDELGELIRKFDYRFRHEPMGDETDSWERALARITGERDL